MFSAEAWVNVALLCSCYVYILLVIFATGRITRAWSKNSSRKFLHIMIGNLPLIIPFFSYNAFPLNFPFFVAAPFIIVTFLVSPYSPVKSLSRKMPELTEVTEGGHQLGLVFYAVSYTVLALFFSTKPYVIAAGILPMAYGDAAASLVGEKIGRHQFRIFAKKSVEGSVAMFVVSFVSVAVSFLFFSVFYPLPLLSSVLIALGVATVATVSEALTPKGVDNITVPFFSVLLFLFLIGGGLV
jgi:dolichol kinase